MPQFIPGAQGLYPYQDAGRNDYEGIGNILWGLTNAMSDFNNSRRQSQRDIVDLGSKYFSKGLSGSSSMGSYSSDMMGPSSMGSSSMGSYSGAPSQSSGFAGVSPSTSPMSALSGAPPQQGGYRAPPQPSMSMPSNQTSPMQAMTMQNPGSQNTGFFPWLDRVMGKNNNEDLMLKRMLLQSQIEENRSQTEKNRRPSASRSTSMEDRAYIMALKEAQRDVDFEFAEPDEQEEILQAAYERNLRVLGRAGKSKKGPKSSVKPAPSSGKTKSGLNYTLE